jgi:hypothetical protein
MGLRPSIFGAAGRACSGSVTSTAGASVGSHTCLHPQESRLVRYPDSSFEEALRTYLKQGQAAVARRQLAALLDRLTERTDLSDQEALGLAYEELRASRSEAG